MRRLGSSECGFVDFSSKNVDIVPIDFEGKALPHHRQCKNDLAAVANFTYNPFRSLEDASTDAHPCSNRQIVMRAQQTAAGESLANARDLLGTHRGAD